MAINSKAQNQTVAILMATFNGGKYIENQILSLQQQTYKNWKLYVQDDGSTDDTLSIIQRMKSYDERINIVNNGKTKQGAGKNFLSLVKNVDSNYAIFCDQDDIWLENKLSSMLAYAEEKNYSGNNMPSIIYADGYAFDDETGHIDFNGISHNHADKLKDFLFFNGGYQGCSIMFNKAMIDIISDYRGYIYLHDDIVSLIAHSMGEVHFLPKKLMLYRQHVEAVTGLKSFNNSLFSKLNSPVNFLLSKKHFLVKESFYKNYNDYLSPEVRNDFENFFKFCHANSKISQIYILLKHRYRLNNSRVKLILKCLLRRTFDQ
ncbi:glycosyltransferase [Bacillus amyloliquefaciens]|nr:glycosyltransferase [Bacillus amyloliquefaciens]